MKSLQKTRMRGNKMFKMRCLMIYLTLGSLINATRSFSVQRRPSNAEQHKSCEYVQYGVQEYCADCSYRALTEVPQDLSKNITCLNLVGNQIKYLSGRVWHNYEFLTKLSLARNKLRTLTNGDFLNLSNLEMLDLSLNHIRYYNIGDDVFRPLVSLKYLDLKQNLSKIFINETYPTSVKHLQALQTLNIDGLEKNIPEINISALYLSGQYGRCIIPCLKGSIFAQVNKRLKSLYLSNCSIVEIEPNISAAWPHLEELDLSWNTKLGFTNVTFGLQNGALKRLRKLNLNSVYDFYKFDMCSSFGRADMEYLNRTVIEVLAVESNNLVRVETDAIRYWPKTLKYLSVRDNMLMYGNYVDEILRQRRFENLIYYDTSQMFSNHIPNDFINNKTNLVAKELSADGMPALEKNEAMSMFTRSQYKDFFQILDERLTKFNITRDVRKSIGTNKIEYVDLSENMPGTVMVTMKLLEYSPSLKFLNISKNYLGYQLLDDNNLIENIRSVKILDLSRNGIIQLLPGVFRNQINLEQLYLSNNKLSNVTFLPDSISHKNLKYLDLSFNHIETIPATMRSQMNSFPNLTMNIAGNNLKCSCDNLEFVSWVKNGKIKFQKLEETMCTLADDSTVTLENLNYEQLHLKCSPAKFYILTLTVSLCILAFIMIVSCGLVYRFKWNLRYLYYMTKFKLTDGYRPLDGMEFEKDVFVSYANEDRGFVRQRVVPKLEEEGSISLLVHDRDFLAGEFVADNILRAVTTTRKTLVILTQAYIRSKWCVYEMNMARMEAADTGRNVICVILKEDIPAKHLPLEIMDIIKKKTYMEFPSENHNEAAFWDRLRATLKHDA